jgi:hypothetical protein
MEEVTVGRSLFQALEQVPDHRQAQGRRHGLASTLALVVCGMLCGCASLRALAEWGELHRKRIASAFGLTRARTPSYPTLHRVLKGLDVEAFESVLGAWFAAHFVRPGEAVAVDGKALRGTLRSDLPGVCVVAAYTHRSGVVIAQRSYRGAGHELRTAEDLLAHLEMKGHVITGDALYATRGACEQIVSRGGTTCSSPKGTAGTSTRRCARTSRVRGGLSDGHGARSASAAVTKSGSSVSRRTRP